MRLAVAAAVRQCGGVQAKVKGCLVEPEAAAALLSTSGSKRTTLYIRSRAAPIHIELFIQHCAAMVKWSAATKHGGAEGHRAVQRTGPISSRAARGAEGHRAVQRTGLISSREARPACQHVAVCGLAIPLS